MVKNRKGIETDRAASPFPFPPVLHLCPSALFPFSPARYLSIPCPTQDKMYKANIKSTLGHYYCVGWAQTKRFTLRPSCCFIHHVSQPVFLWGEEASALLLAWDDWWEKYRHLTDSLPARRSHIQACVPISSILLYHKTKINNSSLQIYNVPSLEV